MRASSAFPTRTRGAARLARHFSPHEKADPGSTPGPQSELLSGERLLDGVDELLNAALALGSLVLVDDALGSGLVEQAARLVGGELGGLGVAGLNGGANALDGGLERTARLR